MSTDREVTRIVRSWLEEGASALPDRVLDNVLDRVPATPQRRAWWPAWRLPDMSSRIRIVIAAAAVVVVALLAINLLPKAGGVGGPLPTPAPTPTPTPAATPAPTPSPIALFVNTNGTPAALTPGTYAGGDPFLLRVTFTVPSGWEGVVAGPNGIFLDQAQGTGIINFELFQKVYANPCHSSALLNPLPGPTVDNLATALAHLPGLTATAPTGVTMAGYQGEKLTLTSPASFAGCKLNPGGSFTIWQLPLGATEDVYPGERDQVWILNVGGQRLVINVPQLATETPAQAAEVQAVLNSVQLAPPASGSSEAPSPGAFTGPTLVDGFTPGTLSATRGGAFAGITCQTLANGQLSVLAGDLTDEFVTLTFRPDGTLSSLSGSVRGTPWQATRNLTVTLNPDKKSGSFSGTDADVNLGAGGDSVSGNFACT